MSTTRKVPQLDNQQFDLFTGAPSASEPILSRPALPGARRFVSGNPSQMFVGTVRLEQYLRDSGELTPLTVAKLLDEQDWELFEQRYALTGRAPYAPRCMMGLILYGIMQGVHSLRALERLARLDVGCMWVCGGIAPDHANIGRFITLHEASLTHDFFESLTRSVLQACRSSSQRVAGDGTVIEAACSHYKLLKEEAVKSQAKAAREALAQAPADPNAQQAEREARECQEIFAQRKANRQKAGRNTASLCISASEPQAMMQPLKRGRGFVPSYKPSVLANEDQIITAIAVDPSSETAVMAQMLDQNARITGSQAQEVLLDAGYFHDEVIAATLERDSSLLCPAGKWPPSHGQGTGKFHKSDFQYDEQTDTYRCPAGQVLRRVSTVARSSACREHAIYASASCSDCPLRDRCTNAKVRKIKGYPEDRARDGLRDVMAQPGAQRVFSQRKAMVEPVFARLRGQQKLDRFRRRGLAAVRREFALHAMAYNLWRAVGLLKALLDLLCLICLVQHVYRRCVRPIECQVALMRRRHLLATW